MNGIIDVGGGMRGIYGAGVFDRVLDDGVSFEYVTGISAGSANAVTYLSQQKGRNYFFYENYSFRKEYMSFDNFIKRGSYVDLDYIYGTLSNSKGDYPVDYKKMMSSGVKLNIIATNALTGEPVSFGLSDMIEDNYYPLKASSCLPIVGKPVFVDGVPFYDGGMSDPVPVEKALNDGCEKIVLILTKPKDVLRTPGKDAYAAKLLKKKYPNSSKGLEKRAENYNKGVELAKKLEKEGRAIIVAPDDCCGVDTLKRTKESLDALYNKGYNDAAVIKEFIK